MDFGCGDGSFRRKVQPLARSVSGVELRKSAVLKLNRDGIGAFSRLGELPRQVETVFMFHVLEHLPSPLATLEEVRSRMSGKDSYLVVEVPSARDLLIKLQCTAFINFTLWSQHLVLHTRESLKLLLQGAGFEVDSVIGVQRYPLSNHIRWLSDGLPGGHLGSLAVIDTESMMAAYGQALASVDATDTIVALARPSD